MKFHSTILGDRDYSLLETVHFGLRLPPTLSSFASVVSCSVSNYTSIKRGRALRNTGEGEPATTRSKLQCFNERYSYVLPSYMSPTDLAPLSFYAFWRMYHVAGNRLVRHKKEVFVSITGSGWPTEAKVSHENHAGYARRTLYAYMPCPERRGTDYIDEVCRHDYGNRWGAFLKAFVEDVKNLWCPPWIARNYKMINAEPEPKESKAGKSS